MAYQMVKEEVTHSPFFLELDFFLVKAYDRVE